MLALIGIFLILLWAVGLVAHIAGGMIHILLVLALIMVILHFLKSGSRST
jgi:hypothetical protein